jgi:hypothetical protein
MRMSSGTGTVHQHAIDVLETAALDHLAQERQTGVDEASG